jgi:hypothetical protein
MSTQSLVPVIGPDGSHWDIPQQNVAAALKGGGKVGQDMLAPDGTHWLIPMDKVHDAVAKGGQLSGAPPRLPQPGTPEEAQLAQNEHETANRYGNAFGFAAGGGINDISRAASPSMMKVATKIGKRILDWAGVEDETEAEALHDAIAHGQPIGKPIPGEPAGTPSARPLPQEPGAAAPTPQPAPAPAASQPVAAPPASVAEQIAARRAVVQPEPTPAVSAKAPTPTPAPVPPVADSGPFGPNARFKITPGMSDAAEDKAIEDGMREDLRQHGEDAYREQRRQFATGSSADVPKEVLADRFKNARFGTKIADVGATSIGSPMQPLSYPSGMEVFKHGGEWFARGAQFGSESFRQVTLPELKAALQAETLASTPKGDLRELLQQSLEAAKKAKQAKP